jgi:hypothetical protein
LEPEFIFKLRNNRGRDDSWVGMSMRDGEKWIEKLPVIRGMRKIEESPER